MTSVIVLGEDTNYYLAKTLVSVRDILESARRISSRKAAVIAPDHIIKALATAIRSRKRITECFWCPKPGEPSQKNTSSMRNLFDVLDDYSDVDVNDPNTEDSRRPRESPSYITRDLISTAAKLLGSREPTKSEAKWISMRRITHSYRQIHEAVHEFTRSHLDEVLKPPQFERKSLQAYNDKLFRVDDPLSEASPGESGMHSGALREVVLSILNKSEADNGRTARLQGKVFWDTPENSWPTRSLAINPFCVTLPVKLSLLCLEVLVETTKSIIESTEEPKLTIPRLQVPRLAQEMLKSVEELDETHGAAEVEIERNFAEENLQKTINWILHMFTKIDRFGLYLQLLRIASNALEAVLHDYSDHVLQLLNNQPVRAVV
ncbi:hypothetical protein P171DRAFT_488020 [Karstenula rhodostoma CBS 690.94]|uniref:Uncharacterized protein n=1 Tax=Karstenula rhodostoma CBS 690.94 TaxID=1392251 RepID=A0A9P4PCX7_9PLEO|nr:hypothetical protein P171DRAFT_488020 [Karstenula rhodostoma CBS 690.94]